MEEAMPKRPNARTGQPFKVELLLNGPTEDELSHAQDQVVEASLSRDTQIGDTVAVSLSQLHDAGVA